MRKILFICCAISFISIGCKKQDEIPPQTGLKRPPALEAKPPEPSPEMKEFYAKTNRKEFTSPKRAVELYASVAAGGPIPMQYLPIQNLKEETRTETRVTFSFTSGTTHEEGQILVDRVIVEGDTLWNVVGIGPK